MANARRSLLGRSIAFALKASVVAIAVATPILGAWLASSMAAYANGPTWLVALSGLLGFPVLPALWELFARARRRRTPSARPPILTTGDRLWLRTLALNGVFLAALLVTKPAVAVRAVSARGDWMLDGRASRSAALGRRAIHRAADGLEWLYARSLENPYEGDGSGDDGGKHKPAPAPLPRGDELTLEGDGGALTAEGDASSPEDRAPPDAVARDGARSWPLEAKLAPSVVALRPEAETSIAAVAEAVVSGLTSDDDKLKALHDWAADRIAYDPAFLEGHYVPQDAESVFARRTAVCAGYAQLYASLARAVGLEARYVVGQAKGAGGEVDGAGHAWNVVRAGGRERLVDVTWDSGVLEPTPQGRVFKKRYRTDYLFAPPEVFGVDHFPNEPRDQLREAPISRGEFMRLPQMAPEFFARGLELRDPTRSQVSVRGSVDVLVDTTRARGETFLLASRSPKAGGESVPCHVERGPLAKVRCDFDRGGDYRVALFASSKPFGVYEFVGELEALDTR